MRGAERAHDLVGLHRREHVDRDQRNRLVRRSRRNATQVLEQLILVGETASGVDPADHVLKLDLAHHHAGQVLEHLRFVGFQYARLVVDDAERAEPISGAGKQRRACIEPDARGSQRRCGKPQVLQKIGNNEHLVALDGIMAGRLVARYLGEIDADRRFEHCRSLSVSEIVDTGAFKSSLASRVNRSKLSLGGVSRRWRSRSAFNRAVRFPVSRR